MEAKNGYRIEKDSMGEMVVPMDALYGPQTQRAVENFPISGYRFSRAFIRALGLVKYASAKANMVLGELEPQIGNVILEAAKEVIDGRWDNQFVLDIFQTGSGWFFHFKSIGKFALFSCIVPQFLLKCTPQSDLKNKTCRLR